MYNHDEGIATSNCAVKAKMISQSRKVRQEKTQDPKFVNKYNFLAFLAILAKEKGILF
jgi:hypothetical protein